MDTNSYGFNVNSIEEAINIQKQLSKKVLLKRKYNSITEINTIAACDVHEENQKMIGAIAIYSFPELKLIDRKIEISEVKNFPYIPGLLAFREGEILIKLIKKLKKVPQITIFDGHGIAHFRRLGIASHIGVVLDIPTIGCAKTILYGTYTLPGENRGDYEYIYDNAEKIGIVLRTKKNTKPIFVSPGHRVDILQSKDIILTCCLKYRIPEPLREAHRLAKIKYFEKRNFE